MILGSRANVYFSMSTQEIYAVMLEIRSSTRGIDTRFTFFQDPVRVEDALGRVFAFPSELSIEALNAEIKTRMKEYPWNSFVEDGDFEIFNAKNANEVLSISGRHTLRPGMSVNMAVVEKDCIHTNKHPTPRYSSTFLMEAVGGGKV